MTRALLALVAALPISLAAAAPARAADPTAIVEDVQGKAAGAQAMDLLDIGAVVRLDAASVLTLGYLKSCTHEVIRGGVVTVGPVASVVADGAVERSRVECDGGQMKLSSEQSSQSGVEVFRSLPGLRPHVIYGTQPLLRLDKPGQVTFERVDPNGHSPPMTIIVNPGAAPIYDFAAHGQSLEPGAAYRATGPSGSLFFRVDAHAQAGGVPLLRRLLKL